MTLEWSKLVPELTVSNFEEALTFYVEMLGFSIVHQRENPAFAYLDQEGVQFMLEEFHAEGWSTGVLTKPFGRGINFQIELSDVTLIFERLKQAEYPFFRDMTESWYETADGLSGQREFLVQDPDGYLLRFSQYLGQKQVPQAEEPAA